MATIDISESEILEALRTAKRERRPDPPGVFTISELAAKSGEVGRTLRLRMALLHRQGKVEVIPVQRERCDGMLTTVPGYRFLKAKRKA